MSIFESVQTWGKAEDVFQIIRARHDGEAGLDAELTARDDEPFTISVRKDGSDPRVLVTHRVDVPSQVVSLANLDGDSKDALHRLVAATEATRDGSVSCTLSVAGRAMTVDIVATVYEDGFSRHQLNAAVMELVKARKTLLPRFDSLITASKVLAKVDQVIREATPTSEKPTTAGGTRRKAAPKAADTKSAEPKATQTKRFCSNCGEVLTPGKSFCTNCGVRL